MSATLTTAAPAWVVDAMRQAGLPPRGGHVVTTHRRERATPRWCTCGEPVWTGLAEREDVVVDPTPTTVDGELFAILTGRRTFQISIHHEISRRKPAHILHDSADVVRAYIAHRCEGPHAIPNDVWKPASRNLNDAPPF